MDIFSLLHRRNVPAQITHYKQEFIVTIATEQERTFGELGAALYLIATFLDAQGNRGLSTRFFDDTLAKDAIANFQHAPAWDGILWKNDDDLWFARKKPAHWTMVWGARYGWDSEIGQKIIETHHEEALAIHAEVFAWLESRKPKRKVEMIAGQRAEELETRYVAYVAAVAHVLYRRYMEHGFTSGSASILRWHYKTLHRDAIAELEYRTQSKPEERSSKKKTKAAIEDWAKAQQFLAVGHRHFFSEAFIDQALECATEPDLDVDFEHLPKLPVEQTPIRWLRDGEMVSQFMLWVDAASDPGSFEYEDKQAIMKQLRAMFARAKGQKTGHEIAVRGLEDTTDV